MATKNENGIFNRAKLQALNDKLTNPATPKEEAKAMEDELDLCEKDPYYFYINYYTVNGQTPKITRGEFMKVWQSMLDRRGDKSSLRLAIQGYSNRAMMVFKEVDNDINNPIIPDPNATT